jgi:hypothetical protein
MEFLALQDLADFSLRGDPQVMDEDPGKVRAKRANKGLSTSEAGF